MRIGNKTFSNSQDFSLGDWALREKCKLSETSLLNELQIPDCPKSHCADIQTARRKIKQNQLYFIRKLATRMSQKRKKPTT
jgi:hypothetical protein